LAIRFFFVHRKGFSRRCPTVLSHSSDRTAYGRRARCKGILAVHRAHNNNNIRTRKRIIQIHYFIYIHRDGWDGPRTACEIIKVLFAGIYVSLVRAARIPFISTKIVLNSHTHTHTHIIYKPFCATLPWTIGRTIVVVSDTGYYNTTQ